MSIKNCACDRLDDLTVVDMGDENTPFGTLMVLKERGKPWWWLSLEVCRECEQHWLSASEERQNDIYCLRRLTEETARRILKENVWPDDFDRYETLLEIGRDSGRRVTFGTPHSKNSSLLWTIRDLAKERPGIRASELASLLNLKPLVATELAKLVMDSSEVQIEID